MAMNLIMKSSAIFDGIEKEPFQGCIMVKGNRIERVIRGAVADISTYVGPDTLQYDCGDKLIMPGFHDSHTHLLMAGMYQKFVNLADAQSEEEAVEMVQKAYEKGVYRGFDWIIGFSWYHVFWKNRTPPTKDSLDAVFPDRPVFLLNAEAHGAWVNSKALEIAGINRETKDPYGGFFGRDERGEITGFLYEAAVGPVAKYALAFSPEQEKSFINSYMKAAAPYGITSLNDVQPYFHGNMGDLATYHNMDQMGELTVRIHAAPDLLGDLDEVERCRDMYSSEKLRINMLKQFLDGVSTTHTALVLEEYADAPGNYGISLTDIEAIKDRVPEAHKRGFSVKLHSCGDRSARMALDYYETAIEMYGKNQCRHAIEHLEMVADTDIKRIRELGVIPSVQPEHIALTQTFAENPYPITLGKDRADMTWPLKSLYDAAGLLAIGSDCPVVDNNPFLEIYRGVTRVHNDGEPQGGQS